MSGKDIKTNQFKKSYGRKSTKSAHLGTMEKSDSTCEKLSVANSNPTHLEDWCNRMKLIANELYDRLAGIFLINDYPEIPMHEVPTTVWTEQNDPAGYKRAQMHDNIKRYGNQVEKLKLAKSQLFSKMIQNMSTESIESVKQSVLKSHLMEEEEKRIKRAEKSAEKARRKAKREARRAQSAQEAVSTEDTEQSSKDKASAQEDIEHDEDETSGDYKPARLVDVWRMFEFIADPLDLWKHIEETHIVRKTSSIIEDRNRAISKFESLQMGQKQTLEKYIEIWRACEQAILATGGELRNDQDLAAKFITSLDSARWKTLQVECANKSISSDPTEREHAYPRNVDEAFIKAVKWRVATDEATGYKPSVAFITEAHKLKFKSQDSKKKHQNGTDKKGKQEQESDSSSKGDIKKAAKKPRRPCILCGEMHWINECDHLHIAQDAIKHEKREDSSNIVLVSDQDVLHTGGKFSDDDILLDNQSGVHIFKSKHLLSELHPANTHLHLSGVNNKADKLICTKQGTYQDVDNIYFHANASANILSWALIEDKYPIYYSQEDKSVTIELPSQSMKFKRRGRHYVYTCLLTTVQDNESKYSRREVVQAKKAKELIERLNYPSKDTLITGLKYGNIDNVDVTIEDVNRAYDIYGNNVAAIRGKSTRPKPSPIDPNIKIDKGEVKKGIISTDIMNINGQKFIVGVLDEIGMVMTVHIPNKSASIIRQALLDIKHTCANNNWNISFRCDNEPAIVHIAENSIVDALVNKFDNIDIHLVGPGRHVPVVERMIRTLKERVRSIINSLPYKCPIFLIKWMVTSVTTSINLLRNNSGASTQGDVRSPKEIFSGIRTDKTRDIRATFGEYVEAYDTNNTIINSMKPRTRGAIILAPTGNHTGTYNLWCLSTNHIIKRDKWITIPINQDVIDYINSFAAKQGTITLDPVYEVPDEDDIMQDNTTGNSTSNGDNEELSTTSMEDIHDIEDIPDNVPQVTVAPADNITIPIDVAGVEEPIIQIPSEESHHQRDTSTSTTTQLERRYPTRSNRGQPPRRFQEFGFHISLKKAIKSMGSIAIQPAVDEILNVLKYKAFHPVDARKLTANQLKNVIRSSLFLKPKYFPNGDFEKLKGRFVGGGNLQDRSLYSKNDTSSPTVELTTIMMITALSAREGRTISTIDIKSAYLNAEIKSKEILMHIDPAISTLVCVAKPEWKSFQRQDGSLIVHLDKALYGCVESAKLWYDNISAALQKNGLTKSRIDPCLFYKNNNGKSIIACVYVDDILVASTDDQQVKELTNALREEYKTITVHDGDIHNYLGMELDFSKSKEVKISMNGFVQEILRDHKVNGTAKTPCTLTLYDQDPKSPRLTSEQAEEFHSAVAKLLYLALRVRPDILLTVSHLTTRVQTSTVQDYEKLQRLLNYLNHTKELNLTLKPDESFTLMASIDAAYGVHNDGKSHTGAMMTLGKGCISAKSSKQKIVSKSSSEAELIAVSDYISNVIHAKDLLQEIGYDVGPAILKQDNKSTIKLIERGRPASERTRHIAIRFFFIKDRVDNKEISIHYCPTDDITADVLTKPLVGAKFYKHRAILLNLHGKMDRRGVLEEA